MHKAKIAFASFSVLALFLATAVVAAARQSAAPAPATAPNFVGTWQVTMAGGGHNGGGAQGGGQGEGGAGGEGGGGGRRGGGARGPQTLVISQDAGKYKVDHKTPRGENSYDATVSGNAISWTESREGRNGETRTMDFKATLDGDTLTGTLSGGRFSRDFTATRAAQPAPDAK